MNNIYDINITTYSAGIGGGQQRVIAPSALEALGQFAHSKDGEALLTKSDALEIRIFKSSNGMVLSSSFDKPEPHPDEVKGMAVPPPEAMPPQPQPQPTEVKPVDIFSAILMPALTALFATAPKRKPKTKRKK